MRIKIFYTNKQRRPSKNKTLCYKEFDELLFTDNDYSFLTRFWYKFVIEGLKGTLGFLEKKFCINIVCYYGWKYLQNYSPIH